MPKETSIDLQGSSQELAVLIREVVLETLAEGFRQGNCGTKTSIEDGLLLPEEAADYLNIKIQTLALWRSQGRGPTYIKLGSSVRYERSALREFVNVQRVGKVA